MTNMAYLASSGLCIGSIACLSQQSTARTGTALGLMGVSGGIAATIGSLPADPAILAQVAGSIPLRYCKVSSELCSTVAIQQATAANVLLVTFPDTSR